MKIFIIAFACEPGRTSEPGVGWNVIGELVKRHELTVLTRKNNRAAIEVYLAKHPEDARNRVRFAYLELPEWFHWLKKHIPCGIQLYQELWQWKAARVYRKAFNKFDIVHHLTFGSIFFTPWAAKYADKFLWGPIGGASGAMESAFLKNEGFKSRLIETVYRFVAWYSYHPLPWVKACRKRCTAVLFRTSELAEKAKGLFNGIVGVQGEGAYPGVVKPRVYTTGKHQLKVMCVGRLIPLKGVKYAIEAARNHELHIYGDGPLRKELERHSLTIGSKAIFHGNVPNAEVLMALMNADILIHPSFREGVSWTILEAMAHGVPVVCQDRAGMKDVVVEGCGIRVAAKLPTDLVNGLAVALREYYEHPELVAEHGRNAQKRVKSVFIWKRIADTIDDTYRSVVQ